MPEISRFLGVVIAMYYNDHDPAHFHARYGDRVIRVAIENGQVLSGTFPRRAQGLVLEWLALHHAFVFLSYQHTAFQKYVDEAAARGEFTAYEQDQGA